jgi:valyl-tRNA synthetase
VEEFFWWYCDFYLELVKGRRYGDEREAASVSLALRLSLSAFQRLLAPFLPFVCEEVWSWWQPGSVHVAPWPAAAELRDAAAETGPGAGGELQDAALALAAEVLREVRKAKSQARRPMRAPAERVLVRDNAARLQALELARDDLVQAGSIEALEPVEAEEFSVEVQLAPAAAD